MSDDFDARDFEAAFAKASGRLADEIVTICNVELFGFAFRDSDGVARACFVKTSWVLEAFLLQVLKTIDDAALRAMQPVGHA